MQPQRSHRSAGWAAQRTRQERSKGGFRRPDGSGSRRHSARTGEACCCASPRAGFPGLGRTSWAAHPTASCRCCWARRAPGGSSPAGAATAAAWAQAQVGRLPPQKACQFAAAQHPSPLRLMCCRRGRQGAQQSDAGTPGSSPHPAPWRRVGGSHEGLQADPPLHLLESPRPCKLAIYGSGARCEACKDRRRGLVDMRKEPDMGL
jgi:hypothetical protein